jgi:hypothetical protein
MAAFLKKSAFFYCTFPKNAVEQIRMLLGREFAAVSSTVRDTPFAGSRP